MAIGAEKSFDTDATTDLESYVEITPSQAVQRGRFNLDLSGQRIVILINPEDKPDIDRMRRDEDSLQALFPSMYQRAIEEAVRLHRKDEHTDKRWAATKVKCIWRKIGGAGPPSGYRWKRPVAPETIAPQM